ncbi:hypothetical protein BV22DRAFT_991223, partial [Leucogyrophana mollusca]
VADGLSRQWDGRERDTGERDGSEWTVSEDWEARTGLVNDILLVTPINKREQSELRERFMEEPLFLEVIDALMQIDKAASVKDRKRARHRASQYMIDDGKLWRLKGGTAIRARSRVECVTQTEARQWAARQHAEGGHWGRDAIKIALMDRIYSPKLDASIIAAI